MPMRGTGRLAKQAGKEVVRSLIWVFVAYVPLAEHRIS
jgi:hypothetical protein